MTASTPVIAFPSTSSARMPMLDKWIMLGYALLLLLLNQYRQLSLPDEGRYGEIGRYMLRHQDWLTPRLDGLPFLHKPPLLHWLNGISYQLFGVNEWAARLAPTLHALILIGAVYAYARTFISLTAARLAAIALGSSVLILGAAQYVNHDLLVATWISVCVLAFAAAFQRMDQGKSHRGLAYVGFAAAGLAILCKGLIGMGLPGLILLVWIALERRWHQLKAIPWITGTVLFLLVCAPWLWLMHQQYPTFWHYFFIEQQFSRFGGKTFNNQQPFLFYVAVLLVGFFPWISTLPLTRQFLPESQARPSYRLAWVWAAVILIFFSIPASKLIGYILPIMAPLALLVGMALPSRLPRPGVRIALTVGSLVFTALMVAGLLKSPMPLPLWLQGWLIAVGLLWLGLSIYFVRTRRIASSQTTSPHPAWKREVGALALASTVTLIAIMGFAGLQNQKKSTRLLANAIVQADPQAQRPLATYGDYPFDLPFYLDRRDHIVVFDDWQKIGSSNRDTAALQLLDGTAFDPPAGKVLLERHQLAQFAQSNPRGWLIVSRNEYNHDREQPAPRLQSYPVLGEYGNFYLLGLSQAH